jgi:hypothetical protein
MEDHLEHAIAIRELGLQRRQPFVGDPGVFLELELGRRDVIGTISGPNAARERCDRAGPV